MVLLVIQYALDIHIYYDYGGRHKQPTRKLAKLSPCQYSIVHNRSAAASLLEFYHVTGGLESIRKMAETMMVTPQLNLSESLLALHRHLSEQLAALPESNLISRHPACYHRPITGNQVDSKTVPGDLNKGRKRMKYKPAVHTKHNLSSIPEPYSSTGSKSLAFIKSYKVGGTHIATLLTLRAYLYNLEIGQVNQWLDFLWKGVKREGCVDIVGTTHPIKNFYHIAQDGDPKFSEQYYCTKPVEFMMFRNPVERLWSGYNYMKRSSPQMTLKYYLDYKKKTGRTKEAPHHMISRYITEAKVSSRNILFLQQDNGMLDIALMILSREANLSICNFMYEPCNGNPLNFQTSKCYSYPSDMNDREREKLRAYAAESGEQEFYESVLLERFKATLQSHPDIESLLEAYKQIRKQARDICIGRKVFKYAEVFLYLDHRIETFKSLNGVFQSLLIGEDLHTIDPVWLCMQWYCHKQTSQTWDNRFRNLWR